VRGSGYGPACRLEGRVSVARCCMRCLCMNSLVLHLGSSNRTPNLLSGGSNYGNCLKMTVATRTWNSRSFVCGVGVQINKNAIISG
jgi:hypothetical protein